jgi:hypothetical protein
VAERLEPAEAARQLTQALEKEKDADARSFLASGLAAVAERLEPAEAARQLTQALEKEKDADARSFLASGLAAVAERLEPAEAARVCASAARLLTQALEKETADKARQSLASGVAAVARRLEPAEAARLCRAAIRSQLQRLKPAPRTSPLAQLEVLASLLPLVDVEGAEPFVLTPGSLIASIVDAAGGEVIVALEQFTHAEALELQLTDATRLPVGRRAVALAATVGMGTAGPLASLPFLPPAREPLPCRLATQDLVDLLKLPTCVHQVRRVVLDQLGNRYRRRFETHWDFVRYAQQQRLDLDFTTPPKRPEWKFPPLFEE